MKDLTAQVDQAVAKVNGFIAKDVAAINDAMKASPRIAVDPVK
jgi:outer membrane murein-binding lipoprotein Lpp